MLVLVLDLDSPRFRVREAAHAALAKYGYAAVPALEWGAEHLRAEGRARCEVLVRPWAADRAYSKACKLCGPRPPWIESRIDGELGWNPPVIAAWSTYLNRAVGRGFNSLTEDYTAYREATRLWVADQVLARRPLAEMRAVLQRLRNYEADWHVYHRAVSKRD